LHVLIVDDDLDIRSTLREALEFEGHTVRAVANGREALEDLRGQNAVCVILLDLMMPVMNGWEFREEQLKDPRIAKVPVLVISADGNAEVKAASLTANGYLKKPIRVKDLFDAVARYCPRIGPAN
jgi:CheY-like chemotaxis protein